MQEQARLPKSSYSYDRQTGSMMGFDMRLLIETRLCIVQGRFSYAAGK